MKLLWVSNAAFTRTGYGTGTRQMTQGMLRTGQHEPIVLAYWGLQGATLDIEGVTHISPRAETWANDCMVEYHEILGTKAIIIHRDIWVNEPSLGERAPVAAWFPIDAEPVDEKIVNVAKNTRWLATMSLWGQEQLRKAGFKAHYLPHGVDTNVFSYNRDRSARALHGIPDDAFLVTMVAANKGVPPRKGWPEAFQAVAELQRRHPDVWLYCHTNPTESEGGPNLQKLAAQCEMNTAQVRLLNPVHWFLGLDDTDVAGFYAMSDVLLNPAYGEGFGIPILEAQAVGTPVVVGRNSAQTEIALNGISVGGDRMWMPYAWWSVPRVGEIVDALEHYYQRRDSRAMVAYAAKAAQTIAKHWSAAAVYDRYGAPWLAQIESDLS